MGIVYCCANKDVYDTKQPGDDLDQNLHIGAVHADKIVEWTWKFLLPDCGVQEKNGCACRQNKPWDSTQHEPQGIL